MASGYGIRLSHSCASYTQVNRFFVEDTLVRRSGSMDFDAIGALAGARGRLERQHTSVRRPALILEHTRWPRHSVVPRMGECLLPDAVFPQKKEASFPEWEN